MIDSISFDVPTAIAAALVIVISIIALYWAEIHKINSYYQSLKLYDLSVLAGYSIMHCNGVANLHSCLENVLPPGVKYQILPSLPAPNPALCGKNYTFYVTPIYSPINGTVYLIICEPL